MLKKLFINRINILGKIIFVKISDFLKVVFKKAITRKAIVTELTILLGLCILIPVGNQVLQTKYGADFWHTNPNILEDYVIGPITVSQDGTIPEISLPPKAIQKLNYSLTSNKRFLLGFRDVSEDNPQSVTYSIPITSLKINDSIDVPGRWFQDRNYSTQKTVDAYGNLDDSRSMGTVYEKDHSFLSVEEYSVEIGTGPSYIGQAPSEYHYRSALIPFTFEGYPTNWSGGSANVLTAKLVLGKATLNMQRYNGPNTVVPAAGRKFELLIYKNDLQVYPDTAMRDYPADPRLWGFRSLDLKEFFLAGIPNACRVFLSTVIDKQPKNLLAFVGSILPKFSAGDTGVDTPDTRTASCDIIMKLNLMPDRDYFPRDFQGDDDLAAIKVDPSPANAPANGYKNGDEIKLNPTLSYTFTFNYKSGIQTGNPTSTDKVYTNKVVMVSSGIIDPKNNTILAESLDSGQDIAPLGAINATDGSQKKISTQNDIVYAYRENYGQGGYSGVKPIKLDLNSKSIGYTLFAFYRPTTVNVNTALAIRPTGDGEVYLFSKPSLGLNIDYSLYSDNGSAPTGSRLEYRRFGNWFSNFSHNTYFNPIVLVGVPTNTKKTMTSVVTYGVDGNELRSYKETDFTPIDAAAYPAVAKGTQLVIPWVDARFTTRIKIIFGTPGEPLTYTVTLFSADGGKVSGGGSNLLAGNSVTITAIPSSGYHFSKWLDWDLDTLEDYDFSNQSSYTFLMPNSDLNLVPVFEKDNITSDPTNTLKAETKDYQLLLSTGVALKGTISQSDNKKILSKGFKYGTVKSNLNFKPTDDVVNLGVGDYITTLTDLIPSVVYYYQAYAKNTLGENIGDIKSFTIPSDDTGGGETTQPYKVMVQDSIEGVITTGAGSYRSGTSVTIGTNIPPGYDFNGWSDGTKIVCLGINYLFTVNGNIVLTPTFVAKQVVATHTLTLINSDPNGSITASASSLTNIALNTQVNIIVSPNKGYKIKTFTIGSTSFLNKLIPPDDLPIQKSYALTVDNNYSIAATFESVPLYNITLTQTPGGMISSSQVKDISANYGVDIAVSPSPGWGIRQLTIDGVSVFLVDRKIPIPTAPGTFSTDRFFNFPVTKSVTVKAEFVRLYHVAIGTSTDGKVTTTNPLTEVLDGDIIPLIIEPNQGSQLKQLDINGKPEPTVVVLTGSTKMSYNLKVNSTYCNALTYSCPVVATYKPIGPDRSNIEVQSSLGGDVTTTVTGTSVNIDTMSYSIVKNTAAIFSITPAASPNFTAPDAPYLISDISIDGTPIGDMIFEDADIQPAINQPSLSYQLSLKTITADNIKIKVTFAPISNYHLIKIITTGQGMLTPISPSFYVSDGAKLSLKITAAQNYKVGSIVDTNSGSVLVSNPNAADIFNPNYTYNKNSVLEDQTIAINLTPITAADLIHDTNNILKTITNGYQLFKNAIYQLLGQGPSWINNITSVTETTPNQATIDNANGILGLALGLNPKLPNELLQITNSNYTFIQVKTIGGVHGFVNPPNSVVEKNLIYNIKIQLNQGYKLKYILDNGVSVGAANLNDINATEFNYSLAPTRPHYIEIEYEPLDQADMVAGLKSFLTSGSVFNLFQSGQGADVISNFRKFFRR